MNFASFRALLWALFYMLVLHFDLQNSKDAFHDSGDSGQTWQKHPRKLRGDCKETVRDC